MLRDRFDRQFGTLRISVTDRCNFRCVYCMPAHGVELAPREDVLSFEEIARVVRIGAELGLRDLRLTGGEPTVRRDLPLLIQMLREIPDIRDIAITTNGARLVELAQPLKNAGLNRLNISLDTLKRDRAQVLARRDLQPQVLAGIDAAVAADFDQIKFNAVVLRDVNTDELCDLVHFAHERGAQMRFIEWMPMGQTAFEKSNRLVTATEMREILSQQFILQPLHNNPRDPARLWRCEKTGATVGFIASMSEHFCDSCNRMRLTSLGGLRPCLHQNAEVDVRALLRRELFSEDERDVRLRAAFQEAADLKWAGHGMNNFVPLHSLKEMVSIGG